MRPECAAWETRWLHGQCYCRVGLYYGAGGECTVRGADVWQEAYTVYSIAAASAFLCALCWILRRLACLCAAGESSRLQKGVHGICLCAAVLRCIYLATEEVLVQRASVAHPRPSGAWQKLAGLSYSSFFPLSAVAFLGVCRIWLQLSALLDEPEGRRSSYRVPYYAAALLLLGIEALHDVAILLEARPVFEACYFCWLGLVSVGLALLGTGIAQRLYRRVSAWVADEGFAIFRRTSVSAATVSAIAVCFLLLSVVQALFGRYHAWPMLACWALGHLLEVVYLVVIVKASGRVRPRASAPEASFRGSFASSRNSQSLLSVPPRWPSLQARSGEPLQLEPAR